MTFFKNLARDEQGATAIEYGLIAALIAVAAITAMTGGRGADSGRMDQSRFCRAAPSRP